MKNSGRVLQEEFISALRFQVLFRQRWTGAKLAVWHFNLNVKRNEKGKLLWRRMKGRLEVAVLLL